MVLFVKDTLYIRDMENIVGVPHKDLFSMSKDELLKYVNDLQNDIKMMIF